MLSCWAKYQDLRVSIEAEGKTVVPSPASLHPYGFSSECESTGLAFELPSADHATITMQSDGKSFDLSESIVVLPVWPSNVKDKLVGLDLSRELSTPSKAVGGFGVLLVVVGFVTALRRRRRSSGIMTHG
jgi:hypothetical protein